MKMAISARVTVWAGQKAGGMAVVHPAVMPALKMASTNRQLPSVGRTSENV
jgi:hypothetical protein